MTSSELRRAAETPFPRWVDSRTEVNLREVAPGLFVGGQQAFLARPLGTFRAVVSLYRGTLGPEREAQRAMAHGMADAVLFWPFSDGDAAPDGMLGAAARVIGQHLPRPVLVHCQAGLSRSASVAYAFLRLSGLPMQEALRRVFVANPYPRARTIASAEAWVRRQKGGA